MFTLFHFHINHFQIAAYGMLIGMIQQTKAKEEEEEEVIVKRLDGLKDYLDTARPTAVNLFYATERMKERGRRERKKKNSIMISCLREEANLIFQEDVYAGIRMCTIGKTNKQKSKHGLTIR